MRLPMKMLICAALGCMVSGTQGSANLRKEGVSYPSIPAECEARVAYDRDSTLPGYLLPTTSGPRTCIPFTTVAAEPPRGYKGDFYVDEFSDAKLRNRWAACKKDKHCRKRVFKQVLGRHPPNREYGMKDPRARFLLGKVDEPETGDLDLSKVRRPAYFARAPYREAIAELDSRTHVVEFTTPPDPYERIHKGLARAVKIRGWYVPGDGVADADGKKRRAVVVLTTGGGGRISAIEEPGAPLYRIEPNGDTSLVSYPDDKTGTTGQILWREIAVDFQRAGFDVLLYDRRGVGMSSGYSDTNTLQQGRDILAMVAAVRTGEGLRAMTADGLTLAGVAARDALADGRDLSPSTLLFGSSRGSMSSGWAMTINFDRDCTYDLPRIACRPAHQDKHIKGAILFSEFASGAGYVSANTSEEDEKRGLGRDRGLFIAGSQVEHNIVFFPSSAILGGADKWPAVFLARGLWDYASALQGTMDLYRRVRGLKELVVARAPHPLETWPEVEQRRAFDRMIAFAEGAIAGKTTLPGGRPWHDTKSLVATTSDVWEASTRPTVR